MAFADLERSEILTLPAGSVKANPSVNSPNDGNYNSEVNMKWMTRKLYQKPFIVGDTSEDVRNAFSMVTDKGDTIDIRAGKVSIDGFLIKIADNQHISFDADDGDATLELDLRYVNSFVSSLTNQICPYVDESTTDLNNVVFYNYKTTTEDYEDSWLAALNDNLTVGYVKVFYDQDFSNQFIIPDDNSSVTYNNKTIPVIIPDVSITSPDVLRQVIEAQTTISVGEPVATLVTQSGNRRAIIYYPLNLKYSELWNEEESRYDKILRVYFSDIFGMHCYLAPDEICSNTYPNTLCNQMQIYSNPPLSSLQIDSGCLLNTAPNRLYDFDILYYDPDGGSRNYKRKDSISGDPGQTPPLDVFVGTGSLVKLTTSTLVSNYMPYVNEIDKIRTNLDYYCFSTEALADGGIPNDKRLQVQIGADSQDPQSFAYTPVCLFTSDGILCPDGFKSISIENSEEKDIVTQYPVEGYLHWIKRMYVTDALNIHEKTQQEERIKTVTIQELKNWTGFETYYKVIFKQLSLYLHATYCSLLNYSVQDSDGNLKAHGCGTKVIGKPTITDEEFDAVQAYSFYSRVKQENNTFITYPDNESIYYYKDKSSDYEKTNIKLAALSKKTTIIPNEGGDYDGKEDLLSYYSSETNATSTRLDFDDPVNYIRCCRLNTSDSKLFNEDIYKEYKSRNFTFNELLMYKISGSASALISTYVTGNAAGKVSSLVLDDYLMPYKLPSKYRAKNDEYLPINEKDLSIWMGTKSQQYTNASTDNNSIINGMNFCWNSYAWNVTLPYTAQANYDSLDYLQGVDFNDNTKYDGLKFSYKFPDELTNKDLTLFNLIAGSTLTMASCDRETCAKVVDTSSKESKISREAYIDISKIYDPDNGDITNTVSSLIDDSMYPKVLATYIYSAGRTAAYLRRLQSGVYQYSTDPSSEDPETGFYTNMKCLTPPDPVIKGSFVNEDDVPPYPASNSTVVVPEVSMKSLQNNSNIVVITELVDKTLELNSGDQALGNVTLDSNLSFTIPYPTAIAVGELGGNYEIPYVEIQPGSLVITLEDSTVIPAVTHYYYSKAGDIPDIRGKKSFYPLYEVISDVETQIGEYRANALYDDNIEEDGGCYILFNELSGLSEQTYNITANFNFISHAQSISSDVKEYLPRIDIKGCITAMPKYDYKGELNQRRFAVNLTFKNNTNGIIQGDNGLEFGSYGITVKNMWVRMTVLEISEKAMKKLTT